MTEEYTFSHGAALIVRERVRQVEKKKYDHIHDDCHEGSELVWAAIHYATPNKHPHKPMRISEMPNDTYVMSPCYPFIEGREKKWEQSRVKQLVKAGALIAAEIDRLIRLQQVTEDQMER